MTHQGHAGLNTFTAAEIKSIRDIGTYDSDEVVDEAQMKLSKVGTMSKLVFTKEYHLDGSFDKYKNRILFRGDRGYDLYAITRLYD